MILASLIASIHDRRARRRKFRRVQWEIENMSARDLADIGGDQDDLLAGVYRQVYGMPARESLPGRRG
jgi:hypothetical protein